MSDLDDGTSDEICELLGHDSVMAVDPVCAVCGKAVTQWLRVEVSEGRAYTYASFEDAALARGDQVRLPGNIVRGPSTGTVLRVVDGPDSGYSGPYKAILGVAS